jgi:hypothetical protein
LAAVSTYSVERSGTEFNFTMIRGEETANLRSGFSNNAPKAGDVPGYSFGDYFDNSDSIRYDNVSLSVGAGQFLTMPARTQNDGNQSLQLRLFAPGTGYATPVATYDGTRFRRTTFGNSDGSNPGRPGWSYVPFATGISGTYDVEIVNTGGTQGSHIAGLGVWTPRALTAGAQDLAAADFSWGSGGKNFISQTSNSVGTYLDNQITSGDGTSWISYDLNNPDGATTFTASTFYRQGMGRDVNFYLQDVALDGTVTNLGSITLPNTGWGSAFQQSARAGASRCPPASVRCGFIRMRRFTTTI